MIFTKSQKASVARSEADRACDAYRQVHDRTLSELQNWKSNAASRYEPIHNEVAAVFAALFGNGTSAAAASFSSSKAAAPAAAVAAAPVKMVSPAQPQPVDNYSAPVAAPAPAYAPPAAAAAAAAPSLGTATAQWDFTAETPEEVSFKAGDLLDLLECVEGEEWWKVRTPGGAEGLSPSAYMKKN